MENLSLNLSLNVGPLPTTKRTTQVKGSRGLHRVLWVCPGTAMLERMSGALTACDTAVLRRLNFILRLWRLQGVRS